LKRSEFRRFLDFIGLLEQKRANLSQSVSIITNPKFTGKYDNKFFYNCTKFNFVTIAYGFFLAMYVGLFFALIRM